MTNGSFIKDMFRGNRKAPEKTLFLMKEPMEIEDKEETLLGCAFADRWQGLLGEWTPQGPPEKVLNIEEEAVPPIDENAVAAEKQAESSWFTVFTNFSSFSPFRSILEPVNEPGAAANLGEDTTSDGSKKSDAVSQSSGQSKVTVVEENETYGSPCDWPRNLGIDKIYPKNPVIAGGVQVIREKIHDTDLQTTVLEAISARLKISHQKMATTNIPILRRYNMLSPQGKILGLLGKPKYRARIISLFEHQKHMGRKQTLYIATRLIACGQLSLDWIEKNEISAEAGLKDPTDTVPVRVQGKDYHMKYSTFRGNYVSDVILCLGYHRVRYERVSKDDINHKRFDQKAQQLLREDGSTDVFWIDDLPTEGDTVPFMGETEEERLARELNEQSPRETVLQRGESVVAGAEEEEMTSSYPPGFFEDEPEEDEGKGQSKRCEVLYLESFS